MLNYRLLLTKNFKAPISIFSPWCRMKKQLEKASCFFMENPMNTRQIRRQNLELLRTFYRSQAALAKAIGETLSPRTISSILNGKQPLNDLEARRIERILKIPNYFLDNDRVRNSWSLVQKFRKCDEVSQNLINDLLACGHQCGMPRS